MSEYEQKMAQRTRLQELLRQANELLRERDALLAQLRELREALRRIAGTEWPEARSIARAALASVQVPEAK